MEIKNNWLKAKKVMEKIDEEDVVFVASALCLGKDTIIWSDDKDFDRQKEVKIIKTKDLVNKLGL